MNIGVFQLFSKFCFHGFVNHGRVFRNLSHYNYLRVYLYSKYSSIQSTRSTCYIMKGDPSFMVRQCTLYVNHVWSMSGLLYTAYLRPDTTSIGYTCRTPPLSSISHPPVELCPKRLNPEISDGAGLSVARDSISSSYLGKKNKFGKRRSSSPSRDY